MKTVQEIIDILMELDPDADVEVFDGNEGVTLNIVDVLSSEDDSRVDGLEPGKVVIFTE